MSGAGEAFFWGIVAGSSLLVGGVLALRVAIGKRLLGLIMAFGAGVLISAVAYDLVQDAFEEGGGTGSVGLGLAAGAAAFYVGDLLIDRRGGHGRKSSTGVQATGSGLAIVLGTVLDGIPEAIVIGLSLVDGGGVSVAVIAAVFLSNLPEAMAGTAGLAAGGWPARRILVLWTLVMLVTGIASLAGFALFDDASVRVVAFVSAFAGGALLTMLADTMMPEAFENGGREVGLATTLGFGLAFVLATLE
jgi:ZIP family zinc transporter